MGFAAVLESGTALDGGLQVSVPPEWHQGRTAYGGFSSALALSVAQQVGGAGLPPLRSAQIAMIAPLYGEVEARAEVLREGKNAVWVEARITGEKGLGLVASFVFMRPVESVVHLDALPPPADLIALGDAHPFAFREHSPAFLRNNFEVRFARPRGEAKEPEMCWWVRACERQGLDPMVELLLCADATPPGVMSLMAPATPVSTMHWQVNMLSPAPTTQDGWWLLRARGDYAERGSSSQDEAIWSASGEPVLAGMQSIALFG